MHPTYPEAMPMPKSGKIPHVFYHLQIDLDPRYRERERRRFCGFENCHRSTNQLADHIVKGIYGWLRNPAPVENGGFYIPLFIGIL